MMKNIIWVIVAAMAFWLLTSFTDVKNVSFDYVPRYSMSGDRYDGGRDEMDDIFRNGGEYDRGYGDLEAVSRRGRVDGGDRGYHNLEYRHRMRRANGEYAPGHPNSRRGR